MKDQRKITLFVPATLLQKAQKSTKKGITETVRQGLELVAAGQAYDDLRKLRGKLEFSVDVGRLREDR